ncbi:4'-phosphopantetheinyl transferase family protein [Paenibacillus xylaniclasticus]|uniref:4'-phosphopantetheinyl transferase family protein n=1 Tax=Paenibacillus xylaniclasticus TaxID=588083 RepID=UPI000FD9C8A4|nr:MULTISPECIES: 4'-phosphopantetheinyl transferase superfamily protein [Paenibacillus]GFN32185.1 4'-phosphopantetheinyl transferase [Paenibacillus curdlanolyticus]
MLSFEEEGQRGSGLEIYWVRTDDYKVSDIEPRWLHLLDEEEKGVYASYLVESKKLEFIIGRILIKTVMSTSMGCRPEEIVLKKNAYGKPFVEGAKMNFNVSHTSGIVACAFSKWPIGLDVERMVPPPYMVMDKAFVSDEMDYVDRQPTEQLKREAFYSIWTRKEAILKALGKGFAISPTTVKVPVDGSDNWRGEYQLMSFQFHTEYMLSWALKAASPSSSFRFQEYSLLLHSNSAL